MKKIICLAAGLLALDVTTGFGQHPPLLSSGTLVIANNQQIEPPALTKFNLDFPGGTPKQLVAAIEKAMGKPLNVIIPDEDAATKLPPLKLSDITFPQLSDTLKVGSTKADYVYIRENNGLQSSRAVEVGYYFRTTDDRPTDNSVWFFRVTKKPEQPPSPPVEKVCQYYSVAPYLDRGFTVEDITTAIKAGWKMSGVNPTPELNYHKETKLLIAYGEPSKLQSINQVLQTLPSANQEFWRQAVDRMNKLQAQIDQLKQPSPASTNSPTEKSGK
jgi:hypothetical protein